MAEVAVGGSSPDSSAMVVEAFTRDLLGDAAIGADRTGVVLCHGMHVRLDARRPAVAQLLVVGNPRSMVLDAGSGQRVVTTFGRV